MAADPAIAITEQLIATDGLKRLGRRRDHNISCLRESLSPEPGRVRPEGRPLSGSVNLDQPVMVVFAFAEHQMAGDQEPPFGP